MTHNQLEEFNVSVKLSITAPLYQKKYGTTLSPFFLLPSVLPSPVSPLPLLPLPIHTIPLLLNSSLFSLNLGRFRRFSESCL